MTERRHPQELLKEISLRRTKDMKINGRPLLELPPRNVYLKSIKYATCLFAWAPVSIQLIIGAAVLGLPFYRQVLARGAGAV